MLSSTHDDKTPLTLSPALCSWAVLFSQAGAFKHTPNSQHSQLTVNLLRPNNSVCTSSRNVPSSLHQHFSSPLTSFCFIVLTFSYHIKCILLTVYLLIANTKVGPFFSSLFTYVSLRPTTQPGICWFHFTLNDWLNLSSLPFYLSFLLILDAFPTYQEGPGDGVQTSFLPTVSVPRAGDRWCTLHQHCSLPDNWSSIYHLPRNI